MKTQLSIQTKFIPENSPVTSKIGTHPAFHPDEGVGIYCLIHEGSKINCKPTDGVAFYGNSIFKPEEKVCYLGIGGGRYDEHSRDNDHSKKGESSISILAKDLGITKSHPLHQIVQYAHINDTEGAKNMCELGNIMKEMFRQDYTEEEVWVFLERILARKHEVNNSNLDFKSLAKNMKGIHFSKSEILQRMASFNNPAKRTVKRIVLSKKFTYRDLVAVKLVQEFGYKKFRISSNTSVVFVRPEKYGSQVGDLCIGFGEHSFGELPALKMAKVLGIYENGKYSEVMRYVKNINHNDSYNPFELSGLITDAHLIGSNSYETFEEFGKLFDLFVKKQELYLNACKEIRIGFKNRNTSFEKMKDRKGTFKTGIIKTDRKDLLNPAFVAFECDLVILKNSKGQIQILPKAKDFKLNVVMKRFQIAELKNRGYTDKDIDYNLLGKSGSLTICPEWHLQVHEDGSQRLYNGSLTHTSVPATKIGMNFIERVINDSIIAYRPFLKKMNNKLAS